jgi:hypothetical protein
MNKVNIGLSIYAGLCLAIYVFWFWFWLLLDWQPFPGDAARNVAFAAWVGITGIMAIAAVMVDEEL